MRIFLVYNDGAEEEYDVRALRVDAPVEIKTEHTQLVLREPEAVEHRMEAGRRGDANAFLRKLKADPTRDRLIHAAAKVLNDYPPEADLALVAGAIVDRIAASHPAFAGWAAEWTVDAALEAVKTEIEKFAAWVERDRRESDKLLCHVQSMRRFAFDLTDAEDRA